MIKLFHVRGSRSVRSYWLLNELGLPFEVELMPFTMKALRTPEFLALSPAGRVPCIIDEDGTVIFESGAVAQYLCNRYDDVRLGRKTDHPEWTRWVQWIHFSETISVHASYLVQQANFVAPEERSETVVNLERKRLRKTLEAVDRFVAGNEYLLPSGFSAADIAIGYSIYMGQLFANEIEGLRALGDYYARITGRPAFVNAVADMAAARPEQGR